MVKTSKVSTEKKLASSQKVNKKSASSTKFWRNTALVLLVIVVLTQLYDVNIEPKFGSFAPASKTETSEKTTQKQNEKVDVGSLQSLVIPSEGIELPITWGDLGKRMVADGVIDEAKFRALFKNGLKADEEQMLTGVWNDKVVMTQENSRYILDLLWAFGLANKNDILENGEMTDEKYGGDASKFAATGGWTLSADQPMNHYSKHAYVTLTDSQQALVDDVSQNIYRPCCGNSTHFPDCNHGMAMLGLLELMAANGLSEDQMYETALGVNSIWFPQTYIDLATYFKEQGIEWEDVDAKLALSSGYSSAQGYQTTRGKIQSLPKPASGGGGCGA